MATPSLSLSDMQANQTVDALRALHAFMVEKRIMKLAVNGVEMVLSTDSFNIGTEVVEKLDAERARKPRTPVKLENPYFEQETDDDEDTLFHSV